ncbi:MAG: vWA domain-containing protein [Lacipirellulaceae bacterium]
MRRPRDRRGATLVLVAVMCTVLISFGALMLNWSYIELSHSQLRAASDAAAKAAVVSLSRTQSQASARTSARNIASQYRIGGQSFSLRDGDIEFGNSMPNGNGGYSFSLNQPPLNSARVTARLGPGGSGAAVPVLFASLVDTDTFSLEKRAIAGRYDHDICVVVDRSASMAWDMSGVDFRYPGSQVNDSTLQNYFRPPHPTESRWAALTSALQTFKTVVDRRNLNPQIGLVSYASAYTFGLYNSTEVTANQLMSSDTSRFLSAAIQIAQNPIIGDTNIASGLTSGRTVLLRPETRSTANRTLILLSDGRRTAGADPVTTATTLAADRITIHAISFGENADTAVMSRVAQVGGGRHYHAVTGTQLQSAFEQIAEQLPAVLIH